ncbi:MAG: DoxX family protein [Sphingomonadales bacterium]|nr:DoxX family protein [Sphingomonadales bacterium]
MKSFIESVIILKTHFFRVLTSLLFIFSGFIKVNDPKGFGYKLEEYFGVFGIDFLNPIATGLAISICVAEMALGIALLLGWQKRFTLWSLLLMMVFFTFLTFYSAWFNKVTDCGCFGDFLKLTPWQSFSKDVVLLVLVGWLFWRQHNLVPLGPGRVLAPIFAVFSLLSLGVGVYTYQNLPLFDFLPYAVGKSIPEGMKVPEGAPQDVYRDTWYYKVNGTVQEFTTEQAPWDITGAEFVDRKSVLVSKGYQPPVHDFSISNIDGEDYTEDFLLAGRCLLVTARVLRDGPADAWEQLRALRSTADSLGVRFAILTASTPEEIKAFETAHGIGWPLYITDGTTLKTMLRSSPGLMHLKKGTVVNKWPAGALPKPDFLLQSNPVF